MRMQLGLTMWPQCHCCKKPITDSEQISGNFAAALLGVAAYTFCPVCLCVGRGDGSSAWKKRYDRKYKERVIFGIMDAKSVSRRRANTIYKSLPEKRHERIFSHLVMNRDIQKELINHKD